MKNTSLDAKREEFRKYLEKEDVLEYLTKHLVPLYEKADKPTSALEYLKNNFAGKEVEEAKQKPETLESENRDLKKNVERLETEKNALTSEVADLITDKVTDKMDDDSVVTEEEKPIAEAVELKESVPEETPTKATENEDEPMETEENKKASRLSWHTAQDGEVYIRQDGVEEAGASYLKQETESLLMLFFCHYSYYS